MVQTYSNGKKIYSVDMMFAYLNLNKYPITKMKVKDLVNNLEYKNWGDPRTENYYSPMEVLDNPKKYKQDYERIEDADLSYPIIVHKNYIIDGVHRLTKAYLSKKESIKVYLFDDKLMDKFLINKNGDWNQVDKLKTYDYIKLYIQRFHKK